MQEIIYKIFNIAEAALIFLGNITGLGYEMVNYLLFIYIQPSLIILFFILWRREKKKKRLLD
ncbi:hypothetical protein OAO28_01810 [Candidatus Pelagibacter sp.]|jgi:hypothetical protein|nr:hypothetical protein [Candidatus Pelagibacter sp.]|tara:strand:- start:95 stop:280 length:186 start_codon:yes stop_codon:yes gene_type:complete